MILSCCYCFQEQSHELDALGVKVPDCKRLADSTEKRNLVAAEVLTLQGHEDRGSSA